MRLARLFVCALGGVALSFAAAVSGRAETIRLRADYWMPMNGEPDGERPGYVVEIARAVFEPAGDKVEYAKLAWDETLRACRAGEIEGAIGASRIEGEGMVLPKQTIGRSRVALWVRKDATWTYAKTKSLEAIKVGAIQSYSYWPDFDDYVKANAGGERLKLYTGDSPLPQAIRELRDGAIVAMPETMTVFIWNLRELGLQATDFRMAYVHEGDDFFIAFAPTDRGRALAARFDQGLAKLRASGELGKIMQRYGLGDWIAAGK
jgi:polar amino acid transport system substrate-binding protein